ncbi:hypothetical protein ANRL1_03170 [Anaerolineae bacterium]|nr:hypothetical protein ANRL1_03170 [Anaerolineae bacterium]
MSEQTRKIKVERTFVSHPNGGFNTISKIRLQGQWLAQIFPPDSHVIVTIIEHAGKRKLTLEPLPATELPMP